MQLKMLHPSMDISSQVINDIFASARDAIFVVTDSGAIESSNSAASFIFGFTTETLQSQNITHYLPAFHDLKNEFDNETPIVETRAIKSSGLDFPVEISLARHRGQNLISLAIRDITDKKIANKCYLQKTSEFQTIFEVLPACFLRLDPQGTILDYHIGKITNICSDARPMLGAPLSDLFEPEVSSVFRNAFDQVAQTGQPQQFEYTTQRSDVKASFLATIKPFLQEQHIAIIQEITAYKEAEKSLLNYHTLADILPVGVFRCDLAGNYVYHNEFWQELTGDKTHHFKNWLDSVHNDDAARISTLWVDAGQESAPFNAEFRFFTPDHTTVYVQCCAVPEIDENSVHRGYIGVAHNITHSILANREFHKNWQELEAKIEERTADLRAKNRWLQQTIIERKQVEASLREERNFISAILDTASAIIIVCNTSGGIVRVNRCFRELFDIAESDIIGCAVTDLLTDDKEITRTRTMFEQLITGKQPVNYEAEWHTKNGRKMLIAWSNSTILGHDNSVEYIIFTGIDITEKRLAEEEARQHQADLIHVSRLCTMGEMAAGLAHELNQPLAAIANYTQGSVRLLNQLDAPIKSDLIHALKQVTAQAGRASEIIRKLREMVSKSEPQRNKVRLESIIRDTINFAAADIKKYTATVRLRIKDQLPDANVDAIQIEQVLLNLIRNGLESMTNTPTLQKELLISVFLNDAKNLQVSVEDHGEGLPDDLEESKVFDAFFTTKSDGMGMGLAISRSIIEAHGGQMWASRNPTVGTTFHFTLPVF